MEHVLNSFLDCGLVDFTIIRLLKGKFSRTIPWANEVVAERISQLNTESNAAIPRGKRLVEMQ